MKRTTNREETTLSVRFDATELERLRAAWRAREWSLAKFIQAAATEKATNVLNASGPSAVAVHRLLERVLNQLLLPKIWIEDGTGRSEELGQGPHIDSVPVEALSPSQLPSEAIDQLMLVVRAMGTELEPVIKQELDRLLKKDEGLSQLVDPTNATPTSSASQSISATSSPNDKPRSAKTKRKE